MNKALLDTDIYSEILKAIDQTVTRNATTYRQARGRLTFSGEEGNMTNVRCNRARLVVPLLGP